MLACTGLAWCSGFPFRGQTVLSGERMPRLWAKTVSFDSISVGDELPILVKWETEDTIQKFDELMSPESQSQSHEGESAPHLESPATTQQVSITLITALTAYVAELLEKGFKLPNIVAKGSALDLDVKLPVSPGDTLVLSGSVIDKVVEQDLSLIKCQVIIENQSGDTVASAVSTISM